MLTRVALSVLLSTTANWPIRLRITAKCGKTKKRSITEIYASGHDSFLLLEVVTKNPEKPADQVDIDAVELDGREC